MPTKTQLEKIIEMNSRIGNLINEKERITDKKNHSLKKGKSIKQKLDEIVQIIGETIETNRIGIFLLNREHKILPVSTIGYDNEIKKLEYNLGEGLIGKSTLTGDTIYIHDLKENRKKEDILKYSPIYQDIGIYSDMHSALIIPLRLQNKNLGAIEIISEKKNAFSQEYIDSLRVARDMISLSLEILEYNKNKMLEKMKDFYYSLEVKHEFMKGHSERVKKYVSYLISNKELYNQLKLNHESKHLIIESAQLHDIGKILIKDEFLSATGEFISKNNPVREHAKRGYDLLIENGITEKTILDIVRYHHENWDGKGYPDKLSKTRIPIEARIVAIADSFDAICSNRPYKKGLPLDGAIKELENSSEKRFDPDLLKISIPILKREYQKVHFTA